MRVLAVLVPALSFASRGCPTRIRPWVNANQTGLYMGMAFGSQA
jgi:hypothetical protein